MISRTTRSRDPGADEVNRVLLMIAYPAFRFSHYLRGCQLHWVAVRKNSIHGGVHTVVTPDLDELQTALTSAAALPQPNDPGDRLEPLVQP